MVTRTAPFTDGMADIAPWDEEALIASIRADQAGRTGYPEFVSGCWSAGLLHYEVDLAARPCTRHGALGDSYTGPYPHVSI